MNEFPDLSYNVNNEGYKGFTMKFYCHEGNKDLYNDLSLTLKPIVKNIIRIAAIKAITAPK